MPVASPGARPADARTAAAAFARAGRRVDDELAIQFLAFDA